MVFINYITIYNFIFNWVGNFYDISDIACHCLRS